MAIEWNAMRAVPTKMQLNQFCIKIFNMQRWTSEADTQRGREIERVREWGRVCVLQWPVLPHTHSQAHTWPLSWPTAFKREPHETRKCNWKIILLHVSGTAVCHDVAAGGITGTAIECGHHVRPHLHLQLPPTPHLHPHSHSLSHAVACASIISWPGPILINLPNCKTRINFRRFNNQVAMRLSLSFSFFLFLSLSLLLSGCSD